MGNTQPVTYTIDLVTTNEQNITINFRCYYHKIHHITIYNKTSLEVFSIHCVPYSLNPRSIAAALLNKNGNQVSYSNTREWITFYDHMIVCKDKMLLFDDSQIQRLIDLLNNI